MKALTLGSAARALLAFTGLVIPTLSEAAPPPPCVLYGDARLGGAWSEISQNGSVSDLSLAATKYWTVRTCRRGSAEDGCDRGPYIADGVGLNDEISSVRVPAACTLFLYESTGFKGRKSAYLAGDHGEAYGGIPNDSASSARCDCKRADPQAVLPEE